MKKWETIGSEAKGNFRVFSVRKVKNRSPASGKEGEFYVIDAGNWVNVIALTPDNQVVLVEQYRHGSDTVTLEIPGGCIDAEDGSPLIAAQRELLEETGYSGDEWTELGWNDPNPALFSNRCYTYLVRNAKPVKAQALDGMEEIKVSTVPLDSIPRLITEKKITHALIITGFYYLELWRKKGGA
jgi:ADP-ribose pyrophosphatase